MSHATRTARARHLWLGRIALVAAGFLATSAGTAWAYFSASGTGTSGAARAGALTPPRDFSAAVATSSQVTLSWTAPATAPPGTYTYTLSGTLPAGSTCTTSMPSTTTSCSVKGLTGSTAYSWTLAVTLHAWTSTSVQATATTFVTSPTLVGVGAITTWTSPATETVHYPGNLTATDLLVLMLARSHNNKATCPTGWTLRASDTVKSASVHAFLEVCSKVYTGAATSVAMTVDGTATRGSSAEIAAFSGVTTTTPFDTTASSGTTSVAASRAGSGTFTPANFTTTSAGDLALSAVMENSDTTTIPTLALTPGATQGFTAQPSGGMQTTQSDALTFADEAVPLPKLVPFPTWTGSPGTSVVWIGESLALRADPATPGAGGAAHMVQGATGASSSLVTSVSVTLPNAVNAGDALTLTVSLPPGGATVSAVSGGGVSWQQAAARTTPSVGDAEVWDGLASTGGSGAVTVTFSASTPVVLASLSEWSGVASLGATGRASGTGPSVSAGTLGSASDDLVVSAAVEAGASGAVSVDAPFAATSATGTVSGFSAANTVAGPSSLTWATTGPGSWEAVAASFSPTPAPTA